MKTDEIKSKIISLAKPMLPYGVVSTLQNGAFNTASSFQPPQIYNAAGEKMHTFYLQDDMCKMQPYGFVAQTFPRYILWDRFNQALDTQFYTHAQVKNLSKYVAPKRFAYFIESEALVKSSYDILLKDRGLAKEFTAVFTTSDRHLQALPNAKFCPAGGVWYGIGASGGVISENLWQQKTKNISIVSSAKKQCELHKWRIALSEYCKKNLVADTYGTFDGGGGVAISTTLQDYRFSIVVENNISDYYFTEKILNCFASMTIPVYVGARNIGQFFNSDGIIQISQDMSFAEISQILKNCTPQAYAERLAAVQDNFVRVQKFMVIEDWLFSHYQDCLLTPDDNKK